MLETYIWITAGAPVPPAGEGAVSAGMCLVWKRSQIFSKGAALFLDELRQQLRGVPAEAE
jgi:hypothetical protein